MLSEDVKILLQNKNKKLKVFEVELNKMVKQSKEKDLNLEELQIKNQNYKKNLSRY